MVSGLPGGARGGNSVLAPRTPPGSPSVCSAVASAALAPLLEGPVTPGRVIAAGPRAVAVRAGGRLLTLATNAAVRLPCALVVPDDRVPLTAVRCGDAVPVGGGAVRLGVRQGVRRRGLEIRAGRWWDPRPRLGPGGAAFPAGDLAANLAAAGAVLPVWPGEVPHAPGVRARLASAAAALEAAATAALDDHAGAGEPLRGPVHGLVGLGPGSTPSGDDFLAGVLAAARLYGEALGAREAVAVAEALGAASRPALEGTTVLSAALLEHAARAEMCAPAASLCRALAGLEPLRPALAGLLAVGHTSGADLAAGLLCGARLALRSCRAGAGALR